MNNFEKQKEEFYKILFDESLQDMSEMANIRKRVTGLPMNLSMPIEGDDKKYPHNLPRIKFQNSNADKIIKSELIPVSIEDEPKLLVDKKCNAEYYRATVEFIRKYKDVLLAFWKQDIDEEELYELIRKNKNE